MSFVSFSFLVLYLTALVVRWGTGDQRQLRVIALLALSWLFYVWHVPQYIFLILFSTLVDYSAGRLLGYLDSRDCASGRATANTRRTIRQRRGILTGSLFVNLGLLGYFKYAGFLVTSANEAVAAAGPALGWTIGPWSVPDIVLPIGISFYTFQSLSYTIDVYRKKIEPEKSFASLACYIAFFPQLVAGPIVRAGDFLYQLNRRRRFRPKVFCEGAYLILRGLFLKIVVADNLGRIIDQYWEQAASEPQGILAFSMLIFFACQLFCDFAGYSDIARGAAYQLGFRLPVNFNAPYIAASFADFWHRWHITLSQWMRDYVFIPLGGNRRGAIRVALNLFLVMLVSGLWHGANWTFVLWGVLLGLALIIERTIGFNERRPNAFLAMVWFLLVQLIWIFSLGLFRSGNLDQGLAIMQHATLVVVELMEGTETIPLAEGLIVLGWWFTLPVWLLHGRSWLAERTRVGIPRQFERAIYAGFMLATVLTMYSATQQFIYFQF